jgi:putative hydrolase of the HAD superfamily
MAQQIKPTIPRVIVFDYGNVLEGPLDPDAFEDSLSNLARTYGFQSGEQLWNHLYICEAWEKAKRGHISRKEYWHDRLGTLGILTDEGQSEFKRRLYQYRGLRPEMHRLLLELKPYFRLAVLSNTSRKDFARYLEEYRGLKNVFEEVISSAQVGIAKPDPAIYQITIERLRVKPEQVLFIDDLERNTCVAEALGIPAIIFSDPQKLRDDLFKRGILRR